MIMGGFNPKSYLKKLFTHGVAVIDRDEGRLNAGDACLFAPVKGARAGVARQSPRCRFHGVVLSLLALLIVAANRGTAQDIEFQARVDRSRAGQSEPLRLTLSIQSNQSISHLPAPEIVLDAFYVEGPTVSTRTNVSVINFEQSITHVRELLYTLYPRRTGTITIGPARLQVGGKAYQTQPLTVEIVEGVPQSAAPQAAGVAEHLWVQARADRRQAYVGQQLVVDYELFYRFRLDNVGFKEIPTFSGFWVKELFVAQTLQPRRQAIDGVTFNVAPLRQVALFPTRAGRLSVTPLVVSCDVLQQGQRSSSLFDGFFGDAFGGRRQTLLLSSDPLKFEVLPLPEKNRPTKFAGAVGQFTLDVQAQPTVLAVGDPVTLRVVIEGQGNLQAIRLPSIETPPGLVLYEPEVQEEERIENGRYGGRRTYEYILIPEIGGTLEIPAVRFAFFDPERETYRVLESAPVALTIEGAELVQEPEGYGLSRRDIQTVGEDIRYIKPNVNILTTTGFLYLNKMFWALHGLLPLTLLAMVIYRGRQQRLERDVAYARQRQARAAARRRLKRARELLDEERSADFHAELHKAVRGFVADQFNLAAAGLTQDRCAQVLAAQGVETDLISQVRQVLAECDLARFGATGSSLDKMEAMQVRAEQVIRGLERAIRC